MIQLNTTLILSSKESTEIAIRLKEKVFSMCDKDKILQQSNSYYKAISDSDIAQKRDKYSIAITEQTLALERSTEAYQLSKVTPFKREELEKLFDEFTKLSKRADGNYFIGVDELGEILSRLLPNWVAKSKRKSGAKTMDPTFQLFDLNKDGKIEYRELVICLATLFKGSREEKLKVLFDVYDANGDQVLEKKELTAMFEEITKMVFGTKSDPSGIEKAFNTLDSNKDGFLSFEEFKQVVVIVPAIMEFFAPFESLLVHTESKLKLRTGQSSLLERKGTTVQSIKNINRQVIIPHTLPKEIKHLEHEEKPLIPTKPNLGQRPGCLGISTTCTII